MKCLFRSFAPFVKIEMFVYLFRCKALHIPDLISLRVANIFSQCVKWLLVYSVVSFEKQKVLNFWRSSVYHFLCFLFCSYLNIFALHRSQRFSSRSFILVLTSAFRSLIHLQSIFVYDIKYTSKFISFPCGYSGVPTSFIEKALFSPQTALVHLLDNWTNKTQFCFWTLISIDLCVTPFKPTKCFWLLKLYKF